MILVDANLLLYAYDTSSSRHRPARVWWEAQLSGTRPVRMAWATILAFVRIGTHPRVFKAPMAREEAVAHVSGWFRQPVFAVLEPGERHWSVLQELIVSSQAGGNLVPDAHLAALAIEHGAILNSADADFARFAGLSWTNPLTALEA